MNDVSRSLSSMSRGRLLVAHGLIAVIIGGSAFDIAFESEHWPFSNYGMYSGVERTHTLRVIRLFGVVTDAAGDVEVPLVDYDALRPLDQARVAAGLEWIIATTYGDESKRREQLTRAVVDIERRYEDLRRQGSNRGPRLRAVRMYRVFWRLDPWARNVDTPDSKELLLEVPASDSTRVTS
jgi:hypothetical protein